MNKKIVIIVISSLLIFSLGFILCLKPFKAVVGENSSTNGLGKTINIAKDSYSEFHSLNTNYDVLDSDWLNSQLQTVQSFNASRTTEVICANSIEEYKNQFALEINRGDTFGAEFDKIVFASIENNFKFSSHLNYSNYASQFYYTIYSYLPLYGYRLPNNLNLSLYSNNLSQDYVGFLNLLFRNAITPEIFFDRFGTHLVSAAHYGGMMSFNYTAMSNKISLSGDNCLNLKNGLKANILDKLELGTGFNFDSSIILNRSKSLYDEKFSIHSIGGTIFSATNYDYFINNYSSWASSINEDNAALIGLESGGLIPLWDILPRQYQTKREQFKNMCETYISSKTSNDGYHHIIDISKKGDSRIRASEVIIEDSGRFNNPYDKIDLNEITPYGIDVLEDLGYSKIRLTINIDMKEKNKGYQYLWIYSQYNNNDANILWGDALELGGTSLQDYYTTETFSILIDLDKINTTYDGTFIYLLFGASGSFGDDWYNKNVVITYIECLE